MGVVMHDGVSPFWSYYCDVLTRTDIQVLEDCGYKILGMCATVNVSPPRQSILVVIVPPWHTIESPDEQPELGFV